MQLQTPCMHASHGMAALHTVHSYTVKVSSSTMTIQLSTCIVKQALVTLRWVTMAAMV